MLNLKCSILIAFFIFTSEVSAISCNGSKSTSLADEGRPLHNYQVHDQDGLGTCHSNALVSNLYALTGQDISYHHIALRAAASNGASTSVDKRIATYEDPDGETQIRLDNARSPCQALKAIQDQPFMCKRDAVSVEAQFDPDNEKVDFHKLLASFYDLNIAKPDERVNFSKLVAQLDKLRQSSMLGNASSQFCNSQLHTIMKSGEDNYDYRADDDIQDHLGVKLNEYINRIRVTRYMNDVTDSEATRKVFGNPDYEKEVDQYVERIFKIYDNVNIKDERGRWQSITTKEQLLSQLKINSTVAPGKIKDEVQKAFYQELGKEYNTAINLRLSDDNIGERRSAANIQKVVSRFNQRTEMQISGDERFPADLFKDKRGNPLDNLATTLRGSIAKVIPKECALDRDSTDIINFNNQSNIACLGLSGLDISQQAELNKLLRVFFKKDIQQQNGAGSSVGSQYYNMDNLKRLLMSPKENYDDLVMDVLGGACGNTPELQIDQSQYARLSCQEIKQNKVTFKNVMDFYDSLSLSEQVKIIEKTLKTSGRRITPELRSYLSRCYQTPATRSGPDCVSGRAADFQALKTQVKSFNNSVLVGQIYGTKKGQDFMAKVISKRIDKSLTKALSENRPISAQICSSVIENPGNDSRLTSKCSDGMHIVNLTGSRCQNGVLQYQILNSWGDGFRWLDAGSLAKNIRHTSDIRK